MHETDTQLLLFLEACRSLAEHEQGVLHVMAVHLAEDVPTSRQLVAALTSPGPWSPLPPPPVHLIELADDVERAEQAIHASKELLAEASSLSASLWREALLALGARGVARLLHCRFTVGSKTAVLERGMLPLSQEVLFASFNALHVPQAKITVGARALAKHLGRDVTAQFWGNKLHGSEESKNAQAELVLKSVVHNAVWSNVHMLPHDIVAFELRVALGYGARWTRDDGGRGPTMFRGFLEPQDPLGHEVGWVH